MAAVDEFPCFRPRGTHPLARARRLVVDAVAATNSGLRSDVFTDEDEAADWLRLHG